MTLTEIDNIIYEAWKQQQWRKGRNSENPRQNKCIVQFFPLHRWPNDFARHRYVPIGGDFSPFSNDFYKKIYPSFFSLSDCLGIESFRSTQFIANQIFPNTLPTLYLR